MTAGHNALRGSGPGHEAAVMPYWHVGWRHDEQPARLP